MIKNTVLFKMTIVVALIVFGCKKFEANGQNLKDETLKQVADNKNIIVGANRTSEFLEILSDKNVGVVTNQTSVIFKSEFFNEYNRFHFAKNKSDYSPKPFTHVVDSLLALDINIEKVFAPEHGFRGTADAGELVKDGKDTKTGLPIFSLHGKHRKPTKEQLKDIDIMVFDIQDVGVRFYTYISTLHYVMEACAENDIPLLILDRPNPNGNYVAGPTLEKQHSSFLGMHPIPLVHGMTIGEYAQMINGEKWLANGVTCDITIIELENYNHYSTYSLPLRPSPNLPNDQSIMLYPSLGLFEGTNINAGRGTEFQFQRYGAPFLDKTHYTFSYTPVANFGAKYPKHKDKECYGVDLSTVEFNRAFTLKYIIDAYEHSSDTSKFFNTANFTKHAGTEKLQKQIEAGLTEAEIRKSWEKDLQEFQKIRKKYLIYSE